MVRGQLVGPAPPCASAPPSAPVRTERDHLYRDFFKVQKHEAQSLLHGPATHPGKRYLAEAMEAEGFTSALCSVLQMGKLRPEK